MTTTEAPAVTAVEETPRYGEVDYYDACRPNYYLFDEQATDAQQEFLTRHGLALTEDSSDYDLRHLLLPALAKLANPDDDPDDQVEGLVDLLRDTLCPLDCTECADDERGYLFDMLDEDVAEFTKVHPDVTWVVTDWNGDTISSRDEPDTDLMVARYFETFNSYHHLRVDYRPTDAFATVSLDRMTLTVYAFTDPVDRALIEHAENYGNSSTRLDVTPLLAATRELRAAMLEVIDYNDVRLPQHLEVSYNGKPARRAQVYGTIGEADLSELAAVAAPLLTLPRHDWDGAMTLLPDCTGPWANLVAALAATAA